METKQLQTRHKVSLFDIQSAKEDLLGVKSEYLVERGWKKKPFGVVADREWVEPGPEGQSSVETDLDHAIELAIDTEWHDGRRESHHRAVVVRHSEPTSRKEN